MEEIVVALRETHRDAGGMAPTHVIGRRADNRSKAPNVITSIRRTCARRCDRRGIDLRDSEIERLLAENAGLNERASCSC